MSLLNKEEVIKHSAAIQIKNEITFLQRKAWNVLLANAFYDLPTKEKYQININELCEVLGEFKNTTHLKESLKSLVECGLEWNVLNKDGKNKWGITTLLAEVETENGICTYAYSPTLREKLYNPNMYARISLAIQNKFNSKHTLALYELCKDYFDIKRNYGETPWINILSFRKLMGLNENEYSEFKKLNKWIIKDPIKEINDKSDLFVEPKYKREKRKVVEIKLCIKRNPNKNNLLNLAAAEEIQAEQLSHPKTEQPTLFDRLERFGLTPEQAKMYSKEYDSNNINHILDKVEDKFKKGEIKNITAYTITSLKNTTPQSKTPIEIEQEKKMSAEQIRNEIEEQHKLFMEQLKNRFDDHIKAKVNETISNKKEIDKERLLKEFEIKIKSDSFLKDIPDFDTSEIKQSLFECYISDNYLPPEDNDFIIWARKKGYIIETNHLGEFVFGNHEKIS